VGGGGTAAHWNGTTWAVDPTASAATSNDLAGVWGNASNNVYAVGYSGTVIQWNGIAWSAVASGASTSINLYGVGGTGPNKVWIAGDTGTILGWNGTTWASDASGTSWYLGGVWGTGSDTWIAGGGGSVVKNGP